MQLSLDNETSNNKVFLTRVIITNDDIQGFIKEIPEKVHLIGNTKNYEIFDGDAKKAVKYLIICEMFKTAFILILIIIQ